MTSSTVVASPSGTGVKSWKKHSKTWSRTVSDETVKVHIVKVEKFYEFTSEVFDVRGFFSYQKALDFVHELATDMDVSLHPDETEFEVDANSFERSEFGLESSLYYVDDVEVEK
jgi:hypothetical protein